MKVKLGNLAPDALPMSRGRFLTHATKHGPIVHKWPRQRGTAKTPFDWYRQSEFAYASAWASDPEPLTLETAINLTRGTQQVPRDIQVQAMYGNYYRFFLPDGTQLPRYRDMAPNPQWILDLIGDTPGSMLYRDDVGWQLLLPGDAGQVVTMVDGIPTWTTPAQLEGVGPGVLAPMVVTVGTSQNASVNRCQGSTFWAPVGAQFNAVQFICNVASATSKLTPVVYNNANNTTSSLLVKGPQITGVTKGVNTLMLDSTVAISTATLLYAGAQILIAAFSNATSTSVATWDFASSGAIPDPAPATSHSLGNATLHCWLAKV